MEAGGLLDAGHVQPDGYTCGAQSVVMARALLEPGYADRLRERLTASPDAVAHTVLDTHRDLVSARPGTGAPWPRRLGTPPWGVSRALSTTSGIRHRVRLVAWWNVAHRHEQIRAATRARLPVPLYVGSRSLPRHVVLAVPTPEDDAGSAIVVHDPATGRLGRITAAQWCARTLHNASWPVPWLVVLPDLNHDTGHAGTAR